MGANGRAYAQQHWEKERALRVFESRLMETVYGGTALTQASQAIGLG